jgi:beta-N-acetylhexosaminidase
VDHDLAPVLGLKSVPHKPVIRVRSLGYETAVVARHTSANVAGLQSAGVAACVTHFPGHGDTAVDSHLDLPTVTASRDTLLSRELVPFAAAVEAGALSVMTSHVLLPALDPAMPATLSPKVMSLLRAELGFDGLLISDAVDMRAASAGRGEPAAAVLALAAGCDLICLGADKDEAVHLAVLSAVVDAVRRGELSEQRLVEAAGRVLSASRRVRGWRRPPEPGDDGAAAGEVARRALRVAGDLPPLVAPVVLRLRTGSNVAVGEVPWGLPVDGAVLGGRPMLDVHSATPLDEVLVAVGGRPVVALVREPHRHPWVLELLRALAAVRPDVVVVEMGWPGDVELPGAAVIRTYGASRANGAALDALLAGPDRAVRPARPR